MESEKSRNYNLIRKKHILPSIFGLLLSFVLLIMAVSIILNIVLVFLCEAKFESEYNSVAYLADIYDGAADKNEITEVLDKNGRDYLIRDKEGNILFSKGDITCTFDGGLVGNSAIKEKVLVYYDSESKCVEIGSDEDLMPVISSTFSELKNNGLISNFFSNDDAEKTMMVPLYYWISVDLKTENASFIGKASYEVKMRDVGMVFIIVLLAGVAMVALFIILLIKIIKKFTNHRKLMKVFFTDVSTKGHNWMWFTIKGEQLLKKKKYDKKNFAVLDILFVKYNTYCVCHSVKEGEEALQAINRMILKTIKKDEACAHHAAASFAVLLQYDDEEILKKRVKLLLKYLEGVEKTHKFCFHIGIALLPAIQREEGKYLRRSDIFIEDVYNNACAATATLESSDDSAIAFFDDKLVEEQRWIDTVNEKQKKALENEEFVIYYQPKYDPSTNELRGAEALIRWQSPEYGFVTPGRIIPIFEKNGFITEIDHYMITHVAKDQKRWLDQGYACVPVSVNVSRAHFIESDLAEQIRDAVDNEGAPRELIEIELTESAFFDDKKALITTIEKLKSYGFSVSMDDFGAGYSSLNSLKDMPLDVLKLDADFFRGESEGNRGEIVVSEAIRLAKCLNMRTVAEGVEVKEQVDFLAGQGCDMIQGYYFAKPMPGNEYEQRMIFGKMETAQNRLLPENENEQVREMSETEIQPETSENIQNIQTQQDDISDNCNDVQDNA